MNLNWMRAWSGLNLWSIHLFWISPALQVDFGPFANLLQSLCLWADPVLCRPTETDLWFFCGKYVEIQSLN